MGELWHNLSGDEIFIASNNRFIIDTPSLLTLPNGSIDIPGVIEGNGCAITITTKDVIDDFMGVTTTEYSETVSLTRIE